MTDVIASQPPDGYISFAVDQSPEALAASAYAFLEDQIPGWLPAPGNLDAWIIEAVSRLAAELTEVAGTVPTAIFRYLGASLLHFPAREATAADAVSTWSMIDASGWTVNAGTLVALATPDGDTAAFEVVDAFTVDAGETVQAGVALLAVEPGLAGSGLSGDAVLLDPLDYVAAVAVPTVSSGGDDAELDADYLTRLSNLLALASPRPIVPNDFAVLAVQVDGVARATAIDLLNGDTGIAGQARCVSVAVVDEAGGALSAARKAAVLAALKAYREVNFLVFVIDPTYTEVSVDFAATAYAGWDLPDVNARAITALQVYLSPATAGSIPGAQGPSWANVQKIRYLEVADVLQRVDGLDHVDALAVNGGAADVVLAGHAPLPTPGAITGAVTAP